MLLEVQHAFLIFDEFHSFHRFSEPKLHVFTLQHCVPPPPIEEDQCLHKDSIEDAIKKRGQSPPPLPHTLDERKWLLLVF